MVDYDEEELLSSGGKSECIPFEPQAKRKRKYSVDLKTCSVKGAKKVIFGQRNGSRVQSAKKNFCPEHAKMLDRHKC